MPHQGKRPSTIAIEIDHLLEESIRRKKFQLLKEIRASFQFRELILLAHGADIATNDNLAQAILDAKWKNMPVAGRRKIRTDIHLSPQQETSVNHTKRPRTGSLLSTTRGMFDRSIFLFYYPKQKHIESAHTSNKRRLQVDPNALKILCVRHGKTNYTEVFPDLTVEGIKHVRAVTTRLVKEWIEKHHISIDELEIMSSPAMRARGTASLIAGALDPTKHVSNHRGIGAMKWRDKERCLLACNGLSGKGYIDYETEPIFADPELFETPQEVRARWYAFLSEYINMAMHSRAPQCAILVSHYEVFCNITRDLFGIIATKETALGHGETIALSIIPADVSNRVVCSGVFREQSIHKIFDLSSHTIHDM